MGKFTCYSITRDMGHKVNLRYIGKILKNGKIVFKIVYNKEKIIYNVIVQYTM